MEMQNKKNEAEGQIDRMIRERFFPKDGSGGIFVEVGAASPDYLSLSALYRSLGWRIIAVEPNPEFCDLHRRKGYEILPYACGDHDEDNVDFFVVDSHGTHYLNGAVSYESFSSLGIKDSFAALKAQGHLDMKKIQVNLRRLDTILAQHAPEVDHIDILAVDTEGWELEVLSGLNIAAYRPRVMIIENVFNEKKYRTHMEGLNYPLWRRVAPNDIYVSPELFASPLHRWMAYLIGQYTVLRNKE
jgi:FkbM family methyltransferase